MKPNFKLYIIIYLIYIIKCYNSTFPNVTLKLYFLHLQPLSTGSYKRTPLMSRKGDLFGDANQEERAEEAEEWEGGKPIIMQKEEEERGEGFKQDGDDDNSTTSLAVVFQTVQKAMGVWLKCRLLEIKS